MSRSPMSRTAELSVEEKRALVSRLLRRRSEAGRDADRDSGPLSPPQRRLWFLEQLQPGSPVYNVPVAYRVRGRLDVTALEQALGEIVRRHEALRAAFEEEDGEPRQRIARGLAAAVPVIDLTALPPETARREAEILGRREARRPFDLGRPPLARSTVLRCGALEHRLLLTVHHIVYDGWSAGLLAGELGRLYEAFRSGFPSPLPELPARYAGVVAAGRLSPAAEAAALAYWKRQLAGAPSVSGLPTDRPRPPVQSFRGRHLGFEVPAATVRGIEEVARRSGATLFMLLLAALQTLLHRSSGENDVVVGTPIANRGRPELDGVIGFFSNTLVLRTRFAGDPSFPRLLARVKKTALEAYAHQDLPFERLVDELHPDRDLGHNPLFQVLFNYREGELEGLRLAGTTSELLDPGSGTSRFDLTFSLSKVGDELRGRIEYGTDLFEAATVHRLARHLTTLLGAIAAEPERRLSELPLASPGERQQLLVEWNDTAAPYSGQVPIHRLFERQAAQRRDATALVCGGGRLTYGELDARANRLTRRLRRLGVGPEVPVGLHLERTPELLVGLLAILKAGGAYLPLDPAYPAERLRLMIEDAGAPVLLSLERLTWKLPDTGATVLPLDREGSRPGDGLLDGEAGPLATDPSPDSPAYVIYTSGSTGRPKGVVVTHRNAVNLLAAMDALMDPADPGVWLAVTSISFDISVVELLWTLTRGFRVVLQPTPTAAPQRGAAAAPRRRQVDFSLFYFASDDFASDDFARDDPAAADSRYRLLLEGARFADRHGLSAVWTPERHFHRFGGLYPNPAVTGAALAAITERLAIRAGSVVLPLHDPLRVVEEWAVVDNLSGGRVGISFASGWQVDDFVLAPQAYDRRKELMLEGIDTVRRLWRGEAIRRRNGTGREVEVRVFPPPLQRELPVWITSARHPETFRAAGEMGTYVLTHLLGHSLEELREKIALYREAWRAHGHPGEGHVSLMLHTFVGRDREAVREVVREPLKGYLSSSFDLLANLGRSLGQETDLADLPADELAELVDQAFDRFMATAGLLGTPETCLAMVDRLQQAGVDEVACLIDFGVPVEAALESLGGLAQVVHESRRAASQEHRWSLPEALEEHGVTHFQCTPSTLRLLGAEANEPGSLGGLGTLLVGGEALPPTLGRRLAAAISGEVINVYGPTETTVWSTSHPVSAAGGGSIPIGRALANNRVYVLDASLEPVPIGVPGELYIGGEGVTRGYLHRPALSAERYLPDPFGGEPGGRLYRTGDQVRHRPDGTLEFLGRLDHQIKLRGYRIELGEIEALLDQHPGVREAAVAVRDESGEGKLVAYVVPAAATTLPHRPPLEPRGELAPEHRRFTLPNGLEIAHLSDFQTRVGYREIFEDASYLRRGISLPEGAVVFDVGANIGLFTLFVHSRVVRAKVFAFEPVRPIFEVLAANVELYGLDVELFDCGLSDHSGPVELTYYPNMPGLSGLYSDPETDKRITRAILEDRLGGQGDGALESGEVEALLEERFEHLRVPARVRTLSEVIRETGVERIDLLKVDAERSELDILAGIAEDDWPKIHQVVLELDRREGVESAVALLSERGFEMATERLAQIASEGEEAAVEVSLVYARRPAEASTTSAVVGAETAPALLQAYLRERLPDYMVPPVFVSLDHLPRTSNGKVDRRALPAPGRVRREVEAAYQPPETSLERSLAGVFQETLDIDRVGLRDNFFELGANSLTLVRIRGRLVRELEEKVSLVDLFRYPTVGSLALALEARRGSPAGTPGLAVERVRDLAARRAAAVRRRGRARRERSQS